MSVGAYDQVPFTELLREPSVTAGRLRDTRRLRLRRMLPQALSWVTFLPTKAVDELVEELVATLQAAVSIDNDGGSVPRPEAPESVA
ncbi:MAG: hypothetical protein ACRDTA_27910 [Pseudonocardiaceae bacterium]